MDRRREDGEGVTSESNLADRGDWFRKGTPGPKWEPKRESGTIIEFFQRNCVTCSKQNYSEEMIDRLASEKYKPIPCKDLRSLLKHKQFRKLVLFEGAYTPRREDCPKYKPEMFNG